MLEHIIMHIMMAYHAPVTKYPLLITLIMDKQQ